MSDIHFNDDKFKSSNFDPLKPNIQPGMKFEEHQRIVADALRQLAPASSNESDIGTLIQRAKADLHAVRDKINQVDQMVRACGKDHDRAELWKETQGHLLDAFAAYPKDDLLIVLTTFMTEVIIKDIV